MKTKIYTLKNELNGTYEGLFLYHSDRAAVKILTQNALKQNIDLEEIKLYCVGTFDLDIGHIVDIDFIQVPISAPSGTVETPMTPHTEE